MSTEVIVVGAGTAGLSCASRLKEAGLAPIILEKSRGVGGRCATRRIEDQPVDFGPIFLHGANPDFLNAIESVTSATLLPGWPHRVAGTGAPCEPAAFHSYERRLAFAEGVTAFPKHLARGLDVRRQTRVQGLRTDGVYLEVQCESGESLKARTVILALPVEQARPLLEKLHPESKELSSTRSLLTMMATEPCLTVLAGYPLDVPPPDWDVLYPEDSELLMLISHDSAKRKKRRFHVLVYQARPRWSRQSLEEDPSVWSRSILEEAARLVAPWALNPTWTQAHRWRYARTGAATSLTSPLLMPVNGDRCRLGLTGEFLSLGAGVEAAWLSGRRLAERILGETTQ